MIDVINTLIQLHKNYSQANYIVIDEVNSSLIYLGLSSQNHPSQDDPNFFVYRILKAGTETRVQLANGGKENNKWSERNMIFAIPLTDNIYSTNFDGANDYCEGGDIHSFDVTDPFSISMYVNPDDLGANRNLFSKVGASPNLYGYMARHNITTGDIAVQMYSPGGDRFYTFADTCLTAATWNHLVFTYDGSSNINGVRLYIDRVVNATNAPSGTLSGTWMEGQDFALGHMNLNYFYSSYMDEVAIWDKALSQTEVDELNTNGPVDPKEHSAAMNLVSYYRMGDGDTYPTISDKVGSNDLTMRNMAADDFETETP